MRIFLAEFNAYLNADFNMGENSRRNRTGINMKIEDNLLKVVAGAGFEPTTFGL
ncbi:protein of unknown function [Xenorhabdus poinarii G6]|uniref:Uncharacterized protein n=1 Tax=Xenorhabdus poinarii G6 TaxID=1354304 RepID=A0A068QYQ6_9GAMM|nr:protein of unknown function [Xenorhabdus poinarii G6]